MWGILGLLMGAGASIWEDSNRDLKETQNKREAIENGKKIYYSGDAYGIEKHIQTDLPCTVSEQMNHQKGYKEVIIKRRDNGAILERYPYIIDEATEYKEKRKKDGKLYYSKSLNPYDASQQNRETWVVHNIKTEVPYGASYKQIFRIHLDNVDGDIAFCKYYKSEVKQYHPLKGTVLGDNEEISCAEFYDIINSDWGNRDLYSCPAGYPRNIRDVEVYYQLKKYLDKKSKYVEYRILEDGCIETIYYFNNIVDSNNSIKPKKWGYITIYDGKKTFYSINKDYENLLDILKTNNKVKRFIGLDDNNGFDFSDDLIFDTDSIECNVFLIKNADIMNKISSIKTIIETIESNKKYYDKDNKLILQDLWILNYLKNTDFTLEIVKRLQSDVDELWRINTRRFNLPWVDEADLIDGIDDYTIESYNNDDFYIDEEDFVESIVDTLGKLRYEEWAVLNGKLIEIKKQLNEIEEHLNLGYTDEGWLSGCLNNLKYLVGEKIDVYNELYDCKYNTDDYNTDDDIEEDIEEEEGSDRIDNYNSNREAKDIGITIAIFVGIILFTIFIMAIGS